MLGINIVTSEFSLDDRTLEKAFLDSGKLYLGLVPAGSNDIEPQASLRIDKVTIRALCFIRFVAYSMRNPVIYRTAKKVVYLLTI